MDKMPFDVVTVVGLQIEFFSCAHNRHVNIVIMQCKIVTLCCDIKCYFKANKELYMCAILCVAVKTMFNIILYSNVYISCTLQKSKFYEH